MREIETIKNLHMAYPCNYAILAVISWGPNLRRSPHLNIIHPYILYIPCPNTASIKVQS